MSRRGQASFEFLAVFAIALVVFLVLIALSQQQLGQLSASKAKNDATAAVNDLAAAVKDVYGEGPGATRAVFVRIPSGVDPARTFVQNTSIRLSVGGTDFAVETATCVHGALPSTEDGYTIQVTAEDGGCVLVAAQLLSVTPSYFTIFAFTSNNTQNFNQTLNATNIGSSALNVSMTIIQDWSSGSVNVTFSNVADQNFTLAANGSRSIGLAITVGGSANGFFSGRVHANDSANETADSVFLVSVTSQGGGGVVSCNVSYMIIDTYNDSGYSVPVSSYNRSDIVTFTTGNWTASSNVTVNVFLNSAGPGSPVDAFPQVLLTSGSGSATTTWNPAGAATGVYNISVNQSSTTVSSLFNVTTCS